MKKLLILIFGLMPVCLLFAQEFKISAQLRPRFELRDGYKTLSSKSTDPAYFVSQRTRLIIAFKDKNEKVEVGLSLQNVRVWGDVNTLSLSDVNSMAMHEAWAAVWLHDNFCLKAGRQEIVYDDHRIFGSVNWTQQARSHDAFLFRFDNGTHKLHIGLALNADAETLFKTPYTVNNYRTFQYLWYNMAAHQHVKISVLFLNNGVPYDNDNGKQKTAFSQTFGPRIVIAKGKLEADAAFYYQSGKIGMNMLAAIYAGGSLKYGFHDNWSARAGAEYLSGTDMNRGSSKMRSFNPVFGTNHKFNGFMDYFYVGNHANSVGLTDIFVNLNFKKKAFSIAAAPHIFLAPAVVVNAGDVPMDSYLGTEIDLTVGYAISKSVSVNSGYSVMLASETMEILRSGSKDELSHWFWLSFDIKPDIFTFRKDKDKE